MSERVTLWRVSSFDSLDGIGGTLVAGRWHSVGHPVVYCSEDPSTALLETIVHMEIDAEDRPDNFVVLKIQSSQPVSIEQLARRKLGPGWPDNIAQTRAIGDEWLRSGRSLLLEVPSVLVPERRNFLINPDHPERRRLRITARYRHPLDPRLFR